MEDFEAGVLTLVLETAAVTAIRDFGSRLVDGGSKGSSGCGNWALRGLNNFGGGVAWVGVPLRGDTRPAYHDTWNRHALQYMFLLLRWKEATSLTSLLLPNDE